MTTTPTEQSAPPVLSVDDLVVRYGSRRGKPIYAVNGVSFSIGRGETLGLIGESGSGKSTVARATIGLQPLTAGSIKLNGVEVWQQSTRQRRDARQRVQIVFQNPYEALNPRQRIAASVREPLRTAGPDESESFVARALDRVGIEASMFRRWPHELSGGQRQRVCIARALVTDPELVICDEVVSALDVSVQAEILNLLADLQDTYGISYLFISHDLGVVSNISDRVAVMYLGRLVEIGRTEQVVSEPIHPYTRALLASQPKAMSSRRRTGEKPTVLGGTIPSPADPPSGCYFRTRCPLAADTCAQRRPEMREVRPNHWAACHFA